VLTAHPLSSCRIGDDPALSACDDRHELRGHPGIFVTDGARERTSLRRNAASHDNRSSILAVKRATEPSIEEAVMTVTIINRTNAVIAALTATSALALTSLPASADLGAPTSSASRTVTRSPSPAPRLIGIRTGVHSTFDRVVLDLHGRAPGYRVGYVRTVREDGSGKVVDLRGGAQLMVRLTPAQAHRNDATATYTGSRRMTVNDPELREVALVGDFEGVVSIGLGVRAKHGFRVLTLHDPTRIVIDIAH
jgi:GMC oxidoreductase